MHTTKWTLTIEGEGPIGNSKNWDIDRRKTEFEQKLRNDGHKVKSVNLTTGQQPTEQPAK